MKRGAYTAAAVGAGYLLGRTKKMRLALMIAAAGATGKLGGGPRELLQQGVKQLSESPEITKLTDSVRGELLDAARAAATTAATSRIESLSERLQQRPGAEATESKQDIGQEQDEQDRPEERAEAEDTEGAEDEGPEARGTEDTRDTEDTAEAAASPRSRAAPESGRRQTRRRPAQSRTTSAGGESRSESRGRSGSESRGQPRTQARSSSGRSPVRRTRR